MVRALRKALRALQKDGRGTIGQRDNAACSAQGAALRHTPRPHPLPAALAPRTQRCLLPSAGTQICHLASSARPQSPARHPHSFAPSRIALPAALQVAVLRAGACMRLARRIWHAERGQPHAACATVPVALGDFVGIQTGTAVCHGSSTVPWPVPLSLIAPRTCLQGCPCPWEWPRSIRVSIPLFHKHQGANSAIPSPLQSPPELS